MPHTSSPHYLGIDVGGTDVKYGIFDTAGKLIVSERTPTFSLKSPQRVFEYAMEFVGSQNIAAVGLAVPGVLDTSAYILREVVNLPGWLGVPLLSELQRITRLPSVVLNDANAAAYAEHSARSLDKESLALLTLGTGVGCGMVISGRPLGGDHGCAGELGHIAIDFSESAINCTCGSRGHLETYAGAAGVVSRYQKNASSISPDEITPLFIANLAEEGDENARHVIHETAVFVGRAIGLLATVVDPAVVLLGGAMTFGGSETRIGREFLNSVRNTVKATTLVQVGGNITIEFATLGNQAGMIGAAMAAKNQVK